MSIPKEQAIMILRERIKQNKRIKDIIRDYGITEGQYKHIARKYRKEAGIPYYFHGPHHRIRNDYSSGADTEQRYRELAQRVSELNEENARLKRILLKALLGQDIEGIELHVQVAA